MRFYTLLKREVLENKNLFIMAPAVLAGLILLISAWILSQLSEEIVTVGIEYLGVLFDGLSPFEMAPIFMILTLPFILVFYSCAIIYLMNSLYQDRRELSILFWQSMPVSNFLTVLSKIVAIGLVAPLFYIAWSLLIYVVSVLTLSIMGMSYDIEVNGLGYMFMASAMSLIYIYMSAFVTTLWMLPTIGWVMLFSAFAKRTPLMWAIGVFILVGILEDVLFGSQFLGNWVQSRSSPAQYIVVSFQDMLSTLFSYDMLFGVCVGSILVAGAVYMRRFAD